MKHVPPPEGEPLEGLDNLAMAVAPKWGEAILRLAKATERVAAKLDELPAATDGQYIPKARELAKSLIDFLDGLEDTDQDTACDDVACDDNELDGNDRIGEGEDDEEADPPEPSLGSLENFGTGDQERWASGNSRDLEDEHDGSEPDEDGEPSLGSFDGMVSQLSSWKQRVGWFPGSDREQDDSDIEDGDPAEARH
jgi:hypothetical protein